MDDDSLIVLVRNYKECIPRHHGNRNIDGMFYAQTQGHRDGSLDYVGILETYEAWRGNKVLIYYEDLMSDPEPKLRKVMGILNSEESLLNELMDNLDLHRKRSIRVYAGEDQTGGHRSFTKGDPVSCCFILNNSPRNKKRNGTDTLKKNFRK